jgi:hypothetical protein
MDPNQQHSDDEDTFANDILVGAAAICGYLRHLGMPVDEAGIYYLRRSRRWPIGSDGGKLIASKRRLTRHAQKLTAASA